MARQVKHNRRTRGVSRISAKNQVTLPTDALARAGLTAGDRLRASVQAPGQILLVREADPIDRHAGRLTGVYPRGYLEELRREWA
jgi:bifunctional DNA-binding transcriptional regulator/antitoxin component of YhaV-PrlF toxin-antitoxin module